MEEFFISGNKRICFSDRGSGDVIILVHGYLETSEAWTDLAEKLAGKFRVIAIDLPGHGGSEIDGETCSMEYMAGVINDLADHLKIKKFFLTGHSMGGYITLAFAELFPQKLKGYCLFSSHPFADTPEVIEKRKKEIGLIREGKKDLIYPDNIAKMFADKNLKKFAGVLQRFRTIASAIPGEAIIGVLNGMIIRPSRQHVMEGGKIPCLWILGAMDNYFDCDKTRSRVKLPSNARFEVLKNSGHLGFVEEEGRAAEIISEFIVKKM